MAVKYITEKGVMKINPAWLADQAKLGNNPTVADPKVALPIISSLADVRDATAIQAQTPNPLVMSETYTSSVEIIKDSDFLSQFKSPTPPTGDVILRGLTDYFGQYEAPIGMVNKLLALSQYAMNMIIDDSGSMSRNTDSDVKSAGSFVRQRCHRAGKTDNYKLTRWEEAEDKLHILIDMLQFIPTGDITISFLNRSSTITLSHAGKTPAEFAQQAHAQVSQAFNTIPENGAKTPSFRALQSAFRNARVPTMHYFFTDGEPSDATTTQVGQLVLDRANPAENPLTFVTCTDKDEAVGWIDKIEAVKGKFIASIDDFNDEKDQVKKAQGPVFPYSRGMWLISLLVAAINPDDLDALDESTPLTKKTIDDLLGRVTADIEYQTYFNGTKDAHKYAHLIGQFRRTDLIAKDILNPRSSSSTATNSQSFYGGGAPGIAMTIGEAPQYRY